MYVPLDSPARFASDLDTKTENLQLGRQAASHTSTYIPYKEKSHLNFKFEQDFLLVFSSIQIRLGRLAVG